MAYCVRCGVELAPSEKLCPLCLTPVVMPGEKLPEAEKPYPERMETVNLHIDRRYGAKLAMLFLSIPVVAVLACDLAISFSISWSAYVLGAGVCICCWAIFPFYLGIQKPYLYLVMDFLSSAAYLALIAWRTDGMDWYWRLGLPLTLLAGLSADLCVLSARRLSRHVLTRISNMVLILALTLIAVELLTDAYVFGSIDLQWSVYSFISLTAFAMGVRIFARSARLRSTVERRLFM